MLKAAIKEAVRSIERVVDFLRFDSNNTGITNCQSFDHLALQGIGAIINYHELRFGRQSFEGVQEFTFHFRSPIRDMKNDGLFSPL